MAKTALPARKSGMYMISILVFIVLLFVFLVYLQKGTPSKPSTPASSSAEATKPAIVVIDRSGHVPPPAQNVGVPIYPKDLPRYSNSQQPLDYQQVGILTSQETDKEPIVLPLFGRKVYGRSDRWQYYTATDKNNMMRVPLNQDGRQCEDDVGCQELYTGDKLTVDIYAGRQFTATIYKTDAPKYFSSPY